MRRLAVLGLALAAAASPPVWAEHDAQPDRPTSVSVVLAGTAVRVTAQFALEVEGPGVAMNMHSIGLRKWRAN